METIKNYWYKFLDFAKGQWSGLSVFWYLLVGIAILIGGVYYFLGGSKNSKTW